MNIFQTPRNEMHDAEMRYEASRLVNLTLGWTLMALGVVALILGLCAIGVIPWLLLPGLSLAAVGLLTLLGNLATLRRM